MHELSIAQSIVEIVEEQAGTLHATRVQGVRLSIGEAIGVATDSLTFCFAMLASLDPILTNAYLKIDIIPHQALCRHCNKEFHVENFIARCPECEAWSNDIVCGTELQVLEMEIEGSNDYAQSNCSPEHSGGK